MRVSIAATLFMVALSLLGSATGAPAQVKKPIVSIDDIQDLAHTGQAAALREMIETTVINTGKFRIMERGDQGMGVLVKEQALAKSGMVTSNTPGRVGGFEGVDFKVYGTITTGGAGTRRNVGASTAMQVGGSTLRGMLGGGLFGNAVGSSMASNSNCTESSASLAIDIRITDGNTGEIKYAKHVTEATNGGTVCGGASQVDISGLMRAAAQRVSMGLVTIMYPVKVVDVEGDGLVLLNYGEGLLAPGDVFAVYQEGKKIVDPDTGAVLGNSENFLGLARIMEVMPKMSKAALLTSFTPAVGSVAREATPEQMRLLAPAKRR